MLKDNIKTARIAKGLSQEDLAIRLHAVRQTVSKWERGLSVPDADMLLALSEIFEIPVSTLLGENIPETKADDLQSISEKLELINLQLAEKRRTRRKILEWLLIVLCVAIIIAVVALFWLGSPYTDWDYNNPETAVLGTAAHVLEWLFVRIAPVVLAIAVVGIIFLRRKDS